MDEQELLAPVTMSDEAKERVKRCEPVARKLLAILAAHADEIVMGENVDVDKSIAPIAEEVLALYLQENINWGDRNFIYQLALQPISHLGSLMENGLSISWDRAMAKLWGKDALDLKFADVHNALMQGVEPK